MIKKFTFAFLLGLFYLVGQSHAQQSFFTVEDVYKSNKVIFYGYDMSESRLADAKRVGQNIKKYFFLLTESLLQEFPDWRLQRWLEKDTVVFSLDAVMAQNKRIDNDEIVSVIRHEIHKDSIDGMVKRYPITEKEGIGYVIIMECFNNEEKRVSAYGVFFDIASRKILRKDYLNHKDPNSYNRLSDWTHTSIETVRGLLKRYAKRAVEESVDSDSDLGIEENFR